MPKKILLGVALLFSLFALSSCDRFEEAKPQFSEKITGTPEKNIDTLSDDQLLQELESDPGVEIDADFSNLEKELEQL